MRFVKLYKNSAPLAPRFRVGKLPGSPLLLWLGPVFVRVGRY